MKSQKENIIERPPVITIMGHIDHGKSTLLDYVRKTNVVGSEAGGITQRLSAYEVVHKDEKENERTITFLDTPGHEAFTKMRFRGSGVADIGVLVVSAEDGVKPQTEEALEHILKYKLPYIVAITKIDKPNANVERTKQNLLEHNIYLEGLGGDVPHVPISSKTGEGGDELLDLMLLVADLAELTGDTGKNAEGIVIEAHRDRRRGISATLIIKDGALKSGMYVVSGESIAPVRIMENFAGEKIRSAVFSSPVQITGFSSLPEVGAPFATFNSKKEAEAAVVPVLKPSGATLEGEKKEEGDEEEEIIPTIPIVIKADTQGSLDAILHELSKLEDDRRMIIKVVQQSPGGVSENDIKSVSNNKNAIIVAFNTSVDPAATEKARQLGIEIRTFDIIYKLAEWLKDAIAERTPKIETKEKHGSAKILKTFSRTKNKQIVGGRVIEGVMRVGDRIVITRREEEIGEGKIISLESAKASIKEVQSESEFGAQIGAEQVIERGDVIASFSLVLK